jgi:hypothetical protein
MKLIRHFWQENKLKGNVTMSFQELNKIVGKAAKAIHDNEKFPVGVLAAKAQKIAQAFPNDTTTVAMSNFLNKRASTEMLISRAELRNVYHKLFSQNNRFGGFFTEELGLVELQKSKVMQRNANEGKDFTKEDFDKTANPILSNALSEVFDPKGSYKPYSASTAKSAARICLHELNKLVPPKKIDVVAGQEDLILCQANYETPKGWCSVLVPIEIKSGSSLLPTVFLSKIGFVDLTQENLKSHILETAGKNFTVDVKRTLEVIATAKNGGPKPLSEMDMIIAKARAANGSSYTSNGILYQEVDKAQLDVELPHLPEAETFAKSLASSSGVAEFKFGKIAVDTGRKILKQALNNFGYSHPNIAISDVDDNTTYFAVSVDNKIAFKVPMKIHNGNLQYPQFVVCSGSIYNFSKSGISEILNKEDVDGKMLAVASPVYGLKPSELIKQIQESMIEGNLVRAEDALTVLQQSGDEISIKEGFAIYTSGLNGQVKTASQKSCCSKARNVSYSKYTICGHTNLPVHKVYQDKNGDCQPLYRKDISEAEGGSFLHSKVYFG